MHFYRYDIKLVFLSGFLDFQKCQLISNDSYNMSYHKVLKLLGIEN